MKEMLRSYVISHSADDSVFLSRIDQLIADAIACNVKDHEVKVRRTKSALVIELWGVV